MTRTETICPCCHPHMMHTQAVVSKTGFSLIVTPRMARKQYNCVFKHRSSQWLKIQMIEIYMVSDTF